MRRTIRLDVSGLGIIIYSPFAVEHIKEGEDYLQRAFLEPADIAQHVNSSTLTAFGTGSPGAFELVAYDGDIDQQGLGAAECVLRLGLEVRERKVICRDLYDLIRWRKAYDPKHELEISDGFYSLTAYTSFPDDPDAVQTIRLHFEAVAVRPELSFEGAPELCPE